MRAITKNIAFIAIFKGKPNSNGNKIKIPKINKKLEILWILSRVIKNVSGMNSFKKVTNFEYDNKIGEQMKTFHFLSFKLTERKKNHLKKNISIKNYFCWKKFQHYR